MEANELRVGNWVHHDINVWSYRSEDGAISKCDGNFPWSESDWYAIGECTMLLDDVEPILLNEEILLKCGFITSNGELGKEYWNNNFKLDYYRESYQFDWYMCTQIKYLHQLQNLYFALTGEELNIIL